MADCRMVEWVVFGTSGLDLLVPACRASYPTTLFVLEPICEAQYADK